MNLLLLSGGLDSTALAAEMRPDIALTVRYGQLPADAEVRAASNVCAELGIEQHHVLDIDCTPVGSGLLAGSEANDLAPCPEWWPFRNQILVTFAAAWGVARGVDEVIVGSVKGDARHADGRSEFYTSIDALTQLQEGRIKVSAPAIGLDAAELIERSGVSDSVLGWTHSCHRSNLACAACPGCKKRREVLSAVGRLQSQA